MFESERKFSLHVYMCMCKNKMIVLKSRPLMWKAVKLKPRRETERSAFDHTNIMNVWSESVRILIASKFSWNPTNKTKFILKIASSGRMESTKMFLVYEYIQIHRNTHYSCLPMLLPSLTTTTLSKIINQNFPHVILTQLHTDSWACKSAIRLNDSGFLQPHCIQKNGFETNKPSELGHPNWTELQMA